MGWGAGEIARSPPGDLEGAGSCFDGRNDFISDPLKEVRLLRFVRLVHVVVSKIEQREIAPAISVWAHANQWGRQGHRPK